MSSPQLTAWFICGTRQHREEWDAVPGVTTAIRLWGRGKRVVWRWRRLVHQPHRCAHGTPLWFLVSGVQSLGAFYRLRRARKLKKSINVFALLVTFMSYFY